MALQCDMGEIEADTIHTSHGLKLIDYVVNHTPSNAHSYLGIKIGVVSKLSAISQQI